MLRFWLTHVSAIYLLSGKENFRQLFSAGKGGLWSTLDVTTTPIQGGMIETQ
jgi:hypothetical protein